MNKKINIDPPGAINSNTFSQYTEAYKEYSRWVDKENEKQVKWADKEREKIMDEYLETERDIEREEAKRLDEVEMEISRCKWYSFRRKRKLRASADCLRQKFKENRIHRYAPCLPSPIILEKSHIGLMEYLTSKDNE